MREPDAALPIRTTVPTPAHGIIGRDAELLFARAMLRRQDLRLLTLTGAGGVGKTRLAVEIARQVSGDYPQGIVFVPLAAITDPSLVLPTIAAALGIRTGNSPETIGVELDERDLLLIIDNFEQVEEAANQITELLHAAPGLQIIVTSRALLRVSGEHQLQVIPLAVPALSRLLPLRELASVPAVELFTTRAMAATGTFQLNEANAADVAIACSKLDGLPLAIELAAARLRHLPLSSLLAQLDHPLDLLVGGPRDVPARLRTLRDAVAWSYGLLSEGEQKFLRRLAVFSGGFSLEAAQRIAGHELPAATLADIASLLDNSLIVRLDDDSTTPRFGLLETIREFAQEQLTISGEADDIRDRHCAYFLEIAEAANAAMEGPDQGDWALRLRTDQENLRTAIRIALDRRQRETALRLGLELWSYWSTSEHVMEGRRWLEEAVAMGDNVPTRLHGRALHHLGNLALTLFDLPAAERHYRDALAVWFEIGAPDDIATGEMGLGVVSRYRGQYSAAQERYERVVSVWAASGDVAGVAIAEYGIAAILADAGDFAGSRRHHDRAMELRREVGEPYGLAYTLISTATVERWAGSHATALVAASEALARFQELQSNDGLLLAYLQLARLAADTGNDQEALDLLRQSFVLLQAHLRAKAAIESLETLAALFVDRRLALPAAKLLSAATAHRHSTTLVVPTPERAAVERTRTAIANMLGVTAFSTAWSSGQSLSLENAVAIALEAIDDPTQAAAGAAAHDLTRRELEVLALLAEHLSDREIADRLFLSPRTIERHVSNILLKMETPNRRLAAAQAVRERLVTANP